VKSRLLFPSAALAVLLGVSGCGYSFYSPSAHGERIREKERILGERNRELADIDRGLATNRTTERTLRTRIATNQAAIARHRSRPTQTEMKSPELQRLDQESVILRTDLVETQGRISELEAEQTRLRKELMSAN
jgi:predicted  nucleic acid-binding Zn-ribbon protein